MQFNKTINIEAMAISATSPTYIIAEAGVNHNGNMKLAKELIDVAVESKVNAIKFQSFKTEHLILRNVSKAPYQRESTSTSESQYEMLKRLELTKAQNIELKQYCDTKDIVFLTTPFDEYSLAEIDDLNLSAYKISSTDVTNLPFLKLIAEKKKPIILSTGMAYLSEVELALTEIYPINKDVVLLQCTANYPIKDNEVNLSVIKTYMSQFDILVGYSDHSRGIGAAPYAVACGAKVVEKHFTLEGIKDGPDHHASLLPNELVNFVKRIRKVEEYLGSAIKLPTLSETRTRSSLQKSLVARKEIAVGEKLSHDNLVAKRTGGLGISPIYYPQLLGKSAKKNYKKDEIIEL